MKTQLKNQITKLVKFNTELFSLEINKDDLRLNVPIYLEVNNNYNDYLDSYSKYFNLSEINKNFIPELNEIEYKTQSNELSLLIDEIEKIFEKELIYLECRGSGQPSSDSNTYIIEY